MNTYMAAWKPLFCLIFFCGILGDNWAAEPEVKYNLFTLPSCRQADKRLAMAARLNYEHASLRMCVEQLSQRFQFSYWIDRRVDADRPLNLTVGDSSLRECLSKLAQLCDAEVGLVENVVTFAHRKDLANMQYAAVRLHNQLTLVQVADAAAGSSKSKASADAQLRPLTWTKLTTPSELAEQINQSWNIQLVNDLPHDLMNAGQLQPCTLATQLTLLYGGFDRCAAGKRPSELRVLPLPAAGPWLANYSVGEVPNINVEVIKQQHASARLEKANGLWTLVGVTDAHLQLLQAPFGSAASSNGSSSSGNGKGSPRNPRNTPSRDALASQRYDIPKQADKPLGAVLKNLGEQLGLTIRWDKGLPPSAPQTLVTIEANRATLDEILTSLGEQAKLSITRNETEVSIGRR